MTTRNKKGQFIKGHISWNRGKHRSEGVKRKISKAQKGQHHSLQTEFKKGHLDSNTPESKRKISEKMKGKQPKNSINWKGKNHPNWQGGKSFESYMIDWTETLRRSIRERDHYICQFVVKLDNTI